jgi:hypothetical protein
MWWSIQAHCNYHLVKKWYHDVRLPLEKDLKAYAKKGSIPRESFIKFQAHNRIIAKWLKQRSYLPGLQAMGVCL